MPSASAACSIVKPAENRSLTNSYFGRSSFASWSSALSRANKSCLISGAAISASFRSWRLFRQSLRRQPPQFVVNQREQPFRRAGIAVFHLVKDLCDVGHKRRLYRRC